MIVLRQAQRTVAELNWLDYLLAAIGTALPLNSMGIALSRPSLGVVFVSLSLLGILISYVIHIFGFSKQRTRWDALLYVVIAMVAIYGSRSLNGILPDDGFPRDLLITGILSWMLLLGSFTLWRDSTLLFQAIPGMALFGLIGAFNTYDASPIVFFIYILLWGTLFARVHTRAMLRMAQQAGYSETRAIKDGPWRAMAGTRLALFSALAVGLISLIFAPLVKESVGGLARNIRINMPQPRPSTNTGTTSMLSSLTNVRIGRGTPLLSDEVLFKAKLDQPRYLHTATYARYTSNGWADQGDAAIKSLGAAPDALVDRDLILRSQNIFEKVPFTIRFLDFRSDRLPVPGEVDVLEDPTIFDLLVDGNVLIKTTVPEVSIEGKAFVPSGIVLPTDTQRADSADLPDYLKPFTSTENITESVASLAKEITKSGKNDYEKAMLIKEEIERRVKYNLNAPAAPNDRDAVDWFLFGEVREGYCDLFASSMVLMARSIGIPARIARGYYPNNLPTSDGWYELRGADAHMWAELYFKDFGWVVFDATEGARMVEGGERGLSNMAGPWYRRPWFLMGLNILILIGLFVGAWFIVQHYRMRKDDEGRRYTLMTQAYIGFVKAMEAKSGRLKRLSETPNEYFDSVKESLGSLTNRAEDLNEAFVKAFYGTQKITDEQVNSLRENANTLSKELWKAA